jgi:hypothetical protein
LPFFQHLSMLLGDPLHFPCRARVEAQRVGQQVLALLVGQFQSCSANHPRQPSRQTALFQPQLPVQRRFGLLAARTIINASLDPHLTAQRSQLSGPLAQPLHPLPTASALSLGLRIGLFPAAHQSLPSCLLTHSPEQFFFRSGIDGLPSR